MARTLLLLLSCAPLPVLAQTVVAGGGGHHADADHSIAWTIGEAVTTTVAGGGAILTQGFHQPWADIGTAMDDPGPEAGAITVYPNPVRHVLHVAMDGMPDGHRYILHDAAGRHVTGGRIGGTLTEIDMQTYASGGYLLRILGPHDATVRSFKINVTH